MSTKTRFLVAGMGLVAALALTGLPPALSQDDEGPLTTTDGPETEVSHLTLASGKKAVKRMIASQRARKKSAFVAATKALEKDPALRARLLPPNVEQPNSSQVHLYRRGDGPRGRTLLDSHTSGLLDLGEGLLATKDKENLSLLYANLYRLIPSHYLEGLPTPERVARFSLSKVRKAYLTLGGRLTLNFHLIRLDISRTVVINGLVTNPIGACELELGYEAGDEVSDRLDVSEYAADGLMRNIDFALKDDLTCVKDQGNRGTCVAHAVCAAVETQVLVDGGSAENLSEEDAYFQAKISADWEDRYGDGVYTPAALDAFDAADYPFQFENRWRYNRSRSRTPDDPNPVTHLYTNSCVTYTGEMCTEFGFQAEETLTFVPGFPSLPLTIDYDFPARSAIGHEITGKITLADFGGLIGVIDEVQLPTAAVMLESDQPIVMRFDVPPAFDNYDANGYVVFAPGEAARGSHAALLVGYVANADLPAGVIDDPSGVGGYFIVKNSWGTGWADGGFAYLSGEFLERWGLGYYYVIVN